MPMQFAKAKPETGHDAYFAPDNDRVIVKPDEFPKPLYPGDDGFWREFEEVMEEVTAARGKYVYSSRVSPCLKASGVQRADQAAVLVHKDWPGDVLLIAAKACVKSWRKFSSPIASNFTDKVVLLNALVNLAPHWVSPSSFCAKWHFMVPRPEEVAGAIARGELEAPDHVKLGLYSMMVGAGHTMAELGADPRMFTMYPEGCPPHPSYTAMHAAAGGAAATVIKVLVALSDADREMVNMTAHNMAHFRATGGVHYPQDNRVGLWLGQEVVNRKLPKWMEENVGIPAAEVTAALAEVQTDWLAA